MEPGIKPGQTPPIHLIGEYVFQTLCRDLLGEEPGIETCQVYGKRGQSQHGIDLLAHHRDADLEVGQCKCYEKFSWSDIKKASKEFFDHWEKWSKKSIKRFILFVSCDLVDQKAQNEIIVQKAHFSKFGIIYQVWDATKIVRQLRLHPSIVRSHFPNPEYWVPAICIQPLPSVTLSQEPSKRLSIAVDALLSTHLDHLVLRLSNAVEQELERIREIWRQGNRTKALIELDKIKRDNTQWSILAPEVKAKALRFEAFLELSIGRNLNQARLLATEAESYSDPSASDQARLRAMISYYEHGPEAAMGILSGQEDRDSVALKAALLLEMGKVEGCREILTEKIKGEQEELRKPSSEMFRIRALMFLLSKDLSQARLEIGKALEENPGWESLRLTSAQINYFSAISSAVLPERLVSWPEPINWTCVKEDDESLTRLREAQKQFRELIQSPDMKSEDLQFLETWYLASLANDREKQDEAHNYCRSLLLSNPVHYQAIAWATARNFGLDLKSSRKKLEKVLEEKVGSIPQILALVSCYIERGSTKKALKLLEASKTTLSKANAHQLWTRWYVEVLVLGGKHAKAQSVLDLLESHEDIRYLKSILLRTSIKKQDDWKILRQHLQTSYIETKDPKFLLECCEVMAQHKAWAEVVEHSEQLIKEVSTGEALRLAAICAYNAKMYELCLKLVDENRQLFKQNKLPVELQRIRISSLRFLGNLPQAIVAAQTLSREEPTTEHQLALAELYSKIGNLDALVLIVRQQLINRSDIDTRNCLRLAWLVHLEDHALAVSLWKKALSAGIQDSLLGEALELGFQLGLDDELEQLQARAMQLAQKGQSGFFLPSHENIVAAYVRYKKDTERYSEGYRKSIVPIHLLSDRLRQPLVNLYHGGLRGNEISSTLELKSLLFIRHGGRSLNPGFPKKKPEWNLHVDITAILLAAHLEILEKVECAYKPIHIPADLVPALIFMRKQLLYHQPSRITTFQKIIDLVERGDLNICTVAFPSDGRHLKVIEELGPKWASLYDLAWMTNGYIGVISPLMKPDQSGEVSSLPEDADQVIVNCRAIMEALWRNGPLSEEEYKKSLSQLGTEGKKSPTAAIPYKGRPLYCSREVLEFLGASNTLPVVCRNFKVHVGNEELDSIRKELKEDAEAASLAHWLGNLTASLNYGIENGTYLLIPSNSNEEQDDNGQGINQRCLQALFQFPVNKNDAIWVDDRFTNGFLHRDGAEIIGINEVLKALVTAGVLDKSCYYEKLGQLRAANARFIPVQGDEIFHDLQQARIEGEKIIETDRLAGLRRYIAMCLLQGDIIQRPPMPEGVANPHGEIAFIIGLERAIIDALGDLWRNREVTEAMRFAGSEWLMQNLFIDYCGLPKVASIKLLKENNSYLAATTLSGLFIQGLEMKEYPGDDGSIRRGYFEWLDRYVLRKRFDSNPTLCALTAETLKQLLKNAFQDLSNRPLTGAMMKVLQEFCQDLPDSIKHEIWRDSEFMDSIGLKTFQTITIEGIHFDQNDFWSAAVDAINGRNARILSLEPEREIVFCPHKVVESGYFFCFNHPVIGEKRIVEGDYLGLLVESPEKREEYLRRKREWFDCDRDVLDHVVAEIASTEDIKRRIEKVNAWKNTSAAIFYNKLYQKLEKERELKRSNLRSELFPPSVDGMLRYFRMSADAESGTSFQQILASSAESLIKEENIEKAIDRLSSLPVSLPDLLIDKICKLPAVGKRALIKKLLTSAPSPLSRIHFVYILVNVGKDASEYHRLARRVLAKLVQEEYKTEWDDFVSLLKWVNEEFSLRQDVRSLVPHIRISLVWAHAHQLFTIFKALGVPPGWMLELFGGPVKLIPDEIFARDTQYQHDVVHPRNVKRENFILGGVAYCLSGKEEQIPNQKLRFAIRELIFSKEQGVFFPKPTLLRNLIGAPNLLGSFLGKNRGEIIVSILGAEDAAIFSDQSLQGMAQQALKRLEETKSDISAWGLLHAVSGDLPLQGDFAQQFKNIIHETDYSALYHQGTQLGNFALLCSLVQLNNYNDLALCDYLKQQLLKIARYLADRNYGNEMTRNISDEPFNNPNETWGVLFDSCLYIALASRSGDEVIPEFVDLLRQTLDIWRPAMKFALPGIQRFCEELPLNSANEFWPLMIRLRAFS